MVFFFAPAGAGERGNPTMTDITSGAIIMNHPRSRRSHILAGLKIDSKPGPTAGRDGPRTAAIGERNTGGDLNLTSGKSGEGEGGAVRVVTPRSASTAGSGSVSVRTGDNEAAGKVGNVTVATGRSVLGRSGVVVGFNVGGSMG